MTDIPTITQEEAVEVRARKLLAAEYERLGVKVSARRLLADPGADMTQETAAMNVIAALSPNMDHAVGGEEAAWDWLFLKADAGQYAPNDRDYSADEMVGAFMAGLGRSTPPVNQDAVREAAAHAVAAIEMDREGHPLSRSQEEIYGDAYEVVDAVLAVLATPPLDNTGLDAATVEQGFTAGFRAAERALGFEDCDESGMALAIEWEEYHATLAARGQS